MADRQRIVIIDDNANDIAVTRRFLERHGYDVVAAQNYTWGAHGMTFRLSRTRAAGMGESFLSLRIRPGFSGKEGEVVIEAQFPGVQGYLSGSKWVGAPGFSNDAVNNRVTVTLPGGPMIVEWRPDGHVWMTGPVENEFEGTLDPDTLAWSVAEKGAA